MLTHKDCLKRYGDPERESAMTLWDVPSKLEIGVIPKRIYTNSDLVIPLEKAFSNLVELGLITELKTWDGCFNIRNKKRSKTPSLHSWGVAIDINAAWNRYGAKPSLKRGVVDCFKRAGFDWGGDWQTPDGMHLQLAKK